jgi:hypothetical protein
MQLMMPTPMKALRQARNASLSSERRRPGARPEGAAIILIFRHGPKKLS